LLLRGLPPKEGLRAPLTHPQRSSPLASAPVRLHGWQPRWLWPCELAGGASRIPSPLDGINIISWSRGLDRSLRMLASLGLALGGLLGLAGTFMPSDSLRGLARGLDGMALVMASALLTVGFFRAGHDLVASGFLVFAVGQGLIVSGAAMDLTRSIPSFGAGVGLWALALLLISVPAVLPLIARLFGLAAAVLFIVTALRIFAGAPLDPTSSPLPFFVYPIFVATLATWVWTLLTNRTAPVQSADAV
jgi:hypothetical protein